MQNTVFGRTVAMLIVLALMCIAACTQQGRNAAQSTADDALLAAKVRAAIATVDAATVSLVQVGCTNGAITLSGKIATIDERTRVDKAARGVDGVRSVDDRIVVDASAPTASQIEADLALSARIHTALAAQTGVNVAKVHVDVHRGVVTLTGELPSKAHRDVVDETVRGVSGVIKLIDQTTVAAR